MLPITKLDGQMELLNNVVSVSRKKKLNGETTLNFDVIPDESNAHIFEDVDIERKTQFLSDTFIIKAPGRSSLGESQIKRVEAVHVFFDKMLSNVRHDLFSGSQTFAAALQRTFEGTGITYNITANFPAEQFENFGMENSLSLLANVVDRYGPEFEVNGQGTIATFREKVGVYSGFQWRYKHNIKSLNEDKSSYNLSTRIKGYFGKPNDKGKYPLEVTYPANGDPAPNVALYGEKWADPIFDEKITNQATAIKALKKALIDEPQLSQTIDFVDLKAAGYDQGRPSIGDYGFIIYEPMGIKVEARIVEIEEVFMYRRGQWVPFRTMVTLSNIKNRFTDVVSRFAKTTKELGRIKAGIEKIPFSALDNALIAAANAIFSAQTELDFDEGIKAIDRSDSNKMVIVNSAGLGITKDGGNTLVAAITGDGIVADAITTGTLRAILIEGVEIYGSYIEGAEIFSGGGNSYTRIKEDFIESRGTYRRTWRGVTNTSDTMLKMENGMFRARNNTKEWSLYVSDFGISTYADGEGDSDASGTIEFHSDAYSPTGQNSGLTVSSLAGRIALETDNARIYLNTGGANVFVGDMDDNTYPITASAFNQSSRRELKRDIKDLQDNATSVLNQLRVREYKRLTKGEATDNDQWQAGFVLDELPSKLKTEDGIDLYTLLAYTVRSNQQLDKRLTKIENSINKGV